MSWEELDQIGQTSDVRAVEQKREDMAKLCLRIFGSEDGQALLSWLRQMYVDVPIAVPGADPSHAFFAEGCRNVVRDIEARINQARKL